LIAGQKKQAHYQYRYKPHLLLLSGVRIGKAYPAFRGPHWAILSFPCDRGASIHHN
jgi:hypothetical protein